jgi:hypothetical protein
MFCNKCGKELIGTPDYCPYCNAPISNAAIQEIKGWNWGAFLLSWIWGIGNNVWIALLAIIPWGGLVMAIVLGVKGNEWAWRAKKWDNIEHFKRTQKTWAKWGIGIFLGIIILNVLLVLLIPNMTYWIR